MKNSFIALLITNIGLFSQIEVFSSNATNTSSSNSRGKYKPDMSLSFNPYILGRGMFGLYGEYGFNDYLSMKVGLGITTNDYVYELFGEEIGYYYHEEEKHFKPLQEERHSSKVGLFIDAGLKIFPAQHDELEGFYIEPGLRYRRYVSDVILNLNGDPETYKMNYSMIEPNFRVGYHMEHYWIDGLYVDYYIGLAYSQLNGTGYKITYDPVLGNKQVSAATQSYPRPVPLFGFTLGVLISD